VTKIITTLILVTLCVNCTMGKKPVSLDEDNMKKFRQIAWNSLLDGAKKTVIIDWRDAGVSMCTWRKMDVICVTFYTTEDIILGPIRVVIDPYSKKVLGQFERL